MASGTPYSFVCYSHVDADEVVPLIEALRGAGLSIWYDEGITAGSEWTQALADAISGAERVIFMLTPAAAASEHCRRELVFAQDEDKPVVAVELKAAQLPSGLRLTLGNRQIIRDAGSNAQVVQRILRSASSAEEVSHATPHDAQPDRIPGFRAGYLWAGVGLAIALAAVVWFAVSDEEALPEVPTGEQTEATIVPPVADRIPDSIAVLPFENLSPEQDDAWFGDGIHATIIGRLAGIPGLNVVARQSMLAFSGTSDPIPEIAERLRVETVMEGSLQLVGKKLHLSVRLVDARQSTLVWAGDFERPVDDAFAIQAEIALEIAARMQIVMLEETVERTGLLATESPEAMIFYLKARAMDANIRPGMPGAFYTFLDAALEEDPDFGDAHGLKAFGLVLSLGMIRVLDMNLEQHEAAVLFHARQALRSPSSMGLGYASLAMVAEQYGEYDEAYGLWVKALQASPGEFDVLDDYVRFMALAGNNPALAAQAAERARMLNPSDWNLHASLAVFTGRFDDALALVPASNLMSRANILAVSGRFDESRALLDKLDGKSRGVLRIRCYVLARQTDPSAAAACNAYTEAIDRVASVMVAPARRQNRLFVALALGERDAARAIILDIGQGGLRGPFYFEYVLNLLHFPLLETPEMLELRRGLGYPL